MSVANNPNEPTLLDVIEKLDQVSQSQASLTHKQEQFGQELEHIAQEQGRFSQELERFAQEQERFNDRFSNYQQATQWVVQLAFTLIASATLTVIITAILKR